MKPIELYQSLLTTAANRQITDVHIKSDLAPYYRIYGDLFPVDTELKDIISAQTVNEIISSLGLTERQTEDLIQKGTVDLSYEIPNVGYFRVNIFRSMGKYSIASRVLPLEVPDFHELLLPEILIDYAKQKNGLILITGPTGSGKSTTLAALINEINKSEAKHIITIEDPVEYRYHCIHSIISQREVGEDAPSFASALRSALREDPDIILVGEMRDKETMETAISAAETGHMVLATLHTKSAAKTIDRIVSSFDASQQEAVSNQLSSIIKCVVSQSLMKRKDGKGMVCSTEIMVNIPSIANLIRDRKTYQIDSNIQINRSKGMRSMEESLRDHVQNGLIDIETAKSYANNKAFFETLMAQVRK